MFFGTQHPRRECADTGPRPDLLHIGTEPHLTADDPDDREVAGVAHAERHRIIGHDRRAPVRGVAAPSARARDHDVEGIDPQRLGHHDAGPGTRDTDPNRSVHLTRGEETFETLDHVRAGIEVDRVHPNVGRSHRGTLPACYSCRMLIVASEAQRVHHPRTPFLDRGRLVEAPEVPERVDRIVDAISAAGLGAPLPPRPHSREAITRVHSPEYLDFLEHAHARWRADTGLDETSEAAAYARPIRDQPLVETDNIVAALGWYSHDTDPILAGTHAAALDAVDVTLTAFDAVADGRERVAYACARPPGHHAATDSFGGYCYLNNAAIAAQAWADRGARVAIVDIDYHHGNGTQQIFYDRGDVLFVSVHADPAAEYPFFLGFVGERGSGAGEDANRNFPLPAGTGWDAYGPALHEALAVVRKFAPDGIVVSLGVDTALEDPDGFRLVADDFARIGGRAGPARPPDRRSARRRLLPRCARPQCRGRASGARLTLTDGRGANTEKRR